MCQDMETYLAISVGAVLGANARFLLGGWISDRLGAAFPWGTLFINATGSLVIGFLLTLIVDRGIGPTWWRPLLAVGFLGSYTTFSTFSWETLRLAQDGALLLAGLNILGSVAISLLGVVAGVALARLV